MSEENTGVVETQLRLTALDGGSIEASTKMSLEILGTTEVVLALSEMVLAVLQAGLGAEITDAVDGNGNPLRIGPKKIDPLRGDGSVEE